MWELRIGLLGLMIMLFLACPSDAELAEPRHFNDYVHNKNIVRVSDQVEIVVTSESSKFGYWVINHFYLFDLAGLINQVDGKENRLGQSLDEYVIVGDSILKHQNSDTIYVFRDQKMVNFFTVDFDCIADPKCRKGSIWD